MKIIKRIRDAIMTGKKIEVNNPNSMGAMIKEAVESHVPEIKVVKPMMTKHMDSKPPMEKLKTSPDGYSGQGAKEFSETVKKLRKK